MTPVNEAAPLAMEAEKTTVEEVGEDAAQENSKMIRGLLVMQQVQVSVMTSVLFKLHF